MRYFLLFSILLSIQNSSTQSLIGNTIVGNLLDDDTGQSVAISQDGNIVAVGSPKIKNNAGKDIGETRIFELKNGAWTLLGKPIKGLEPYTNSGARIDMDAAGKRVVLGAIFNNNGGSGTVRVFEWRNNDWVQMGSGLGAVSTLTNVGFDVKISGNGKRIVFSTMITTSVTEVSGNVQVFEWNGNNWIKLGSTLASPSTNDGFGLKLDINYEGDQIIVAATTAGTPATGGVGEVQVYQYSGNQWVKKGQLIKGVSLGGTGDVAINSTGSRIIIGTAERVNNVLFIGAVRVYDYMGTQWVQVGSTIFGDETNKNLGNSVDISDDGSTIAFGGNTINNSTGRIFLRRFKNGQWLQIGNELNGIDVSDHFGTEIEIAGGGKSIIIGARVNANRETKPGYAQVWSIPDLTDVIHENNFEINLFPNPAKDKVWITSLNDTNKKMITDLSLLDLLGRQIYYAKQYQDYIDISGFDQGIYSVIFDIAGTRLIKKLFIEK